jgi:hypothetical protein
VKPLPDNQWCALCQGPTLPWCGHGNAVPVERCAATVSVDLVRDDYEGPIPHSFPCLKRAGHDETHLAHVTWLDGED